MSRRRRDLYQVASARDGAHTLAVRNADVPEVVFGFSMAPGHGARSKNLAELRFAFELRVELAENLDVPFPRKYHTLTS